MASTPSNAPESLDRRTVIRVGAVAVGVGAFGAATLSGCGDDPVGVAGATSPLAAEASTSVDASAAASAGASSTAATGTPAAPTGKPATAAARSSSSRATTEDDDSSTSSTKSATKTSTKASTKPATTSGTTKPAQPVDVRLSEIPVGGAIVRNIRGRAVVLSRTASSSVVAFDARCTHQGCPVRPSGGRLECPCHGSAFDLRSGGVLNGPASAQLSRLSVRVHDGGVSLA